MALTDKLTAIADAIRGKTGKTDGLTLEQMPGEIAGIQTGGGGDTSNEDAILDRTITSYRNDRVTTVGRSAFYYCDKLKFLDLPNVEQADSGAFGNISPDTFNAPKLKIVGGECFNAYGGSKLYLPALEKSTGLYAFRNAKITEITLPKYATGNFREFTGCSLLEKADFSALPVIGLNFFSGCSALTTLILRKTDSITNLSSASEGYIGPPIYNGTGFIYVPRTMDDGSDGVAAYRAATNWSSLLPEQFRAIEDYPEICEVSA